MPFAGEFEDLLGRWIFSEKIALGTGVAKIFDQGNDRVGEYRKVGSAASLLDRVVAFFVAQIKLRCDRGSKMSAGRKTHHAEPGWRDFVFFGVRSYVAQGSLGVEHRAGVCVLRGEPILQYKRCNAVRIQPSCCLLPFMIEGKHLVAAPWTDHHASPSRLFLRRKIDAQRRSVGVFVALGARRAVWPKDDRRCRNFFFRLFRKSRNSSV